VLGQALHQAVSEKRPKPQMLDIPFHIKSAVTRLKKFIDQSGGKLYSVNFLDGGKSTNHSD
jgi:hypothetical protein